MPADGRRDLIRRLKVKVLPVTLFCMFCILLLIPHPVVSLAFSYPWNLCILLLIPHPVVSLTFSYAWNLCILLLIPHPIVSLTFSYPWNLCDCVWCSMLLDHFGVHH
jgi:hypothetical protein